jgi:predicted RNase H-like HicB family nuclease
MIEQDIRLAYVLSEYIDRAMAHAVYKKLDNDKFAGTIPPCEGVIAFGETLQKCKDELRSTLGDWIVVAVRFGDDLPIIDGIDLGANIKINRELNCEQMGTMQTS